MRAGIRQLADGRYEHQIRTDGLEKPITICCVLEVRGDEIAIDFGNRRGKVNLDLQRL